MPEDKNRSTSTIYLLLNGPLAYLSQERLQQINNMQEENGKTDKTIKNCNKSTHFRVFLKDNCSLDSFGPNCLGL